MRVAEQQLLLLAVADPLLLGHMKLPAQRPLLGNRTQPVRLVLRGNDQRRGVGVQQLRLQQHIIAEAQTPDQIAVLEPADTDIEVGAQIILFRDHLRTMPKEVLEQLARRG